VDKLALTSINISIIADDTKFPCWGGSECNAMGARTTSLESHLYPFLSLSVPQISHFIKCRSFLLPRVRKESLSMIIYIIVPETSDTHLIHPAFFKLDFSWHLLFYIWGNWVLSN
jgi:hypothetical protein